MVSAYEALGLTPNATPEDIRAAYRRRVREAHPDRHGGSEEAHERFLAIQAAYEILSDPKRRTQYDQNPDAEIPEAVLENLRQRQQQLKRRRARLRRLYE